MQPGGAKRCEICGRPLGRQLFICARCMAEQFWFCAQCDAVIMCARETPAEHRCGAQPAPGPAFDGAITAGRYVSPPSFDAAPARFDVFDDDIPF